jgi:hypothetical protein
MGKNTISRPLGAASILILVLAVAPARAGAARTSGVISARSHAVAGHSLKITVSGLTKGHHARISVAGPRHSRHRVRGAQTLRHLRPGVYEIRVQPTSAPHAARIYPARSKLTARVLAKRGAVVHVHYTTVVPKTTKAVSPKSITRVQHVGKKRYRLHYAGHTGLKAGDVIATGVGPQTPHGLLMKVVSVSKGGSVTTAPATLLDAVPQGQLDADPGEWHSENDHARSRRERWDGRWQPRRTVRQVRRQCEGERVGLDFPPAVLPRERVLELVARDYLSGGECDAHREE